MKIKAKDGKIFNIMNTTIEEGTLMTIIARPQYLKTLEHFQDQTDIIKVITGIRRSGKTFLMGMMIDHLKQQGIATDQIIHLNFENFNFINIKTAQDLYQYVQAHQNHSKRNYLFFDEIQHVDDWEKAVNAFRVEMDADIYITGSNAYLLSGELATLLTGRYVELKVFPLSFKEYFNFKHGTPEVAYQLFQHYLLDGGFPAVVKAPSRDLKVALQNGIFDSIILTDIALRANNRNDRAVMAIAYYLMSEVGNLVSARKIANTLRSYGHKITTVTVINYLTLLERSFLFMPAQRYDLRREKWLSSQCKYYVADNGLRNTRLHRSPSDNLGHQIENVVYLELLRRGYSVNVGKLGSQEIDFMARKGEEVRYYQVTQHLSEHSDREIDNLLLIPDAYQKFLLTLDQMDTGNRQGIQVIWLIDWLLADND